MNFKNVKIAGLNYKIKKIKNLARDYDMLGSCCSNSTEIKLDKDLEEQVLKKILIHEIIEAINFQYELNLDHTIISVLDSVCFEFIKNNKNVIQYLINE